MDDDVLNFDLLAASLRADSADISTWIAALSAKLAGALPGRVTLRRGGLLGNGHVEGVSADLGDWRYTLHLQHGQPVAERTHIVRGIALKTEATTIDAWLDGLARELTALAATSARERAAIQRIIM